ncbi:MAG: murein biosynthesis integral membrane protein MurJ [Phycisphaerae bacterium]
MTSSRGVLSSAKLIAVCTLISRVTGLVRDVLLTRALGASWVQDAFSYGFQIPNLFRRLFGEGSMAPVFVPTFTRTIEHEGTDAAWGLLARTNSLLTVTLVALALLIEVVIAAIWLLATPTSPEQAEARRLLLALTALMLPFMVSICILALWSSILNCVGSFVPAALASLILNFSMIAGILWLGPALGATPRAQAYGIALSVLIAGGLQLIYLLPALRAAGVPLRWLWSPQSPDVLRMLRLLPPVALGQGVLVFGVFLDANICTFLTHVGGAPVSGHFLGIEFTYPLQEGALSVITIAQRLYQFPLGVLAISLATAALPAFSRAAARQEWRGWSGEVRRMLRLAIFEGLLAGSLMVVLAEPIVRLLFEYGQFTARDTPRAAHVLTWYGVGLWAFCAQHIVSRGFYSLGDVRTPLAISCWFVPVNLAMSLVLVWFEGVREAAFAISSSVTAAASVIAGALLLARRSGAQILDGAAWGALARMAGAGIFAALIVRLLRPLAIAPIASTIHAALASRAADTLTSLALGAAVFLLLAWVMRLPEVGFLLGRRQGKPAGAPIDSETASVSESRPPTPGG